MPTDFVYLKLPATDMPREHGLEDRIDQALRLAGLGSVLGWGSSVGEPAAGPSLAMTYQRIDIEVENLDGARRLLQSLLPSLGIPSGTELHYTRQRQPLQDLYQPSGWLQAQGLTRPPRR